MELARVGDVTRRSVERWLAEAGVDLAAARLTRIAIERSKALEYAERMNGRRMSRKQAWREVAKSVRRFNEANGADKS